MPLPGKARVQAAGRGDGEVARVELERGTRADLTEVTGPVVRHARPEDGAGIGAGVCVCEERAQGEPESRHERNRHPGAEPQLGRAHTVHAVRLRSIGLVARSIEPNELEAGGAQLHVKNRGKERSPELTRRVHAVRGRAGCVSDLAEEARAGGQGVEPVAGVTDPHPDEESDVGSIARAPERHRLRSPGVRATLRGHFARHRGDAGEQAASAAKPDTSALRVHLQAAHNAMWKAHWAMIASAAQARGVLTDAQLVKMQSWADSMQAWMQQHRQMMKPGESH